jgi:predicted negative regulator of RcsB-dependent stress response
MFTFRNLFQPSISLTRILAVAAAAIFAPACDDLPRPKPSKQTVTSVAAEPPKPVELPPTPPVTTPAPTVEKPIAKTEPVETQTGDDDIDVDDIKTADILSAARQAIEEGKLDKALALAKVGVDKMPKRSAAWNTLGRVQLQMGKRKSAIESFENAVELNPTNSYARNNLGLALEQAVELEPVEGYMWNNLGMALEQLDRLEEARLAYNKAVEMKSSRAGESLARLKGVESVIRTARVDIETDEKEETTKQQ